MMGSFGLFAGIIMMAFVVLVLSIGWKIYSKANQPGWAAYIPIYNLIVFMWIIKKSPFMLLLLFIPIVNIFFAISFIHGLSKSFGNDVGFTLGLLFLPFIFLPILAFGSDKYIYGIQEKQTYNSRNNENNSANSTVEFK
jgi:hypothetical protein